MKSKLSNSEALSFILAGNATFTCKNTNTGNRFTFKVKEKKNTDIRYVSVMSGTDNESSYSYIGFIIGGKFLYGGTSKISRSAQSIKVAEYIISNLFGNTLPSFIEIWHSGSCGKCGRKLTDPESIQSGLGPFCRKSNKNQTKIF